MSKPLWSVILILTGMVALWRTGIGAWNLIEYNRFGPEVQAEATRYEIISKGSKYALKAYYTYSYGDKTYASSKVLSKPYYLNKAAAEGEIKKMLGMPWAAWVDPKAPGVSTLELAFPLRDCFYAICSLGVFLYFLYLKIHLELLSRSM